MDLAVTRIASRNASVTLRVTKTRTQSLCYPQFFHSSIATRTVVSPTVLPSSTVVCFPIFLASHGGLHFVRIPFHSILLFLVVISHNKCPIPAMTLIDQCTS